MKWIIILAILLSGCSKMNEMDKAQKECLSDCQSLGLRFGSAYRGRADGKLHCACDTRYKTLY